MSRLIPVFALLIFCQCSFALAEGQGKSPAIEVGRPIAEMTAILREHKIEWRVQQFAETRHAPNPDNADVVFDLDEEMLARIYYSESRQVITGIGIIFQPKGQGRITHRRFDAKGIRLEDDGSYSVQFLPKPKADKPTPVLRDYFPNGTFSDRANPLSDLRPTDQPKAENQYSRSTGVPNSKNGLAAKRDATPFEGDWEVYSASYQSAGGAVSYKFRGERLTIESWSSVGIDKRVDAAKIKSVSEWTIKIDKTLSPPRLVMTLVEAPGKPSGVRKEAFEFKNGELWLCEDTGQQITSKSFLPSAGGWVTGLRRIEKRPR